MQLFNRLLFALSIIVISWLLMMTIHEFGHILGAKLTGGTINKVVLHPLKISRTDVTPNPHPTVVVWLGPIIGSLIPLMLATIVSTNYHLIKSVSLFFAGFCLIANGAYIGIGSFASIGDCHEMLRTGTPHWMMVGFGITATVTGLYLWHRLGSPSMYFGDHTIISRATSLLAAQLLFHSYWLA